MPGITLPLVVTLVGWSVMVIAAGAPAAIVCTNVAVV